MKTLVIVPAVALCLASVTWADGPRPFLFLKTGEKFATQEIAGPTVEGLTSYLSGQLSGGTNAFAPCVMNDPVKAAEFCGRSRPAIGIVTAGFYLTYAKALGMEPLLEIKRMGVNEERYALVVRKDASDDPAKLEGKTITTPLAGEQRYVVAVVLQGKLGEEIRLKQTMDVEGAVFDLAEGAKNAADAVLLEDAAWKVFQDDPDSGGKLKVVYRSDDLPGDLVVLFVDKAEVQNADKVKKVLKDMATNVDGQKVLRSIRVEAFADIDQARLSKAEKLFYGK